MAAPLWPDRPGSRVVTVQVDGMTFYARNAVGDVSAATPTSVRGNASRQSIFMWVKSFSSVTDWPALQVATEALFDLRCR